MEEEMNRLSDSSWYDYATTRYDFPAFDFGGHFDELNFIRHYYNFGEYEEFDFREIASEWANQLSMTLVSKDQPQDWSCYPTCQFSSPNMSDIIADQIDAFWSKKLAMAQLIDYSADIERYSNFSVENIDLKNFTSDMEPEILQNKIDIINVANMSTLSLSDFVQKSDLDPVHALAFNSHCANNLVDEHFNDWRRIETSNFTQLVDEKMANLTAAAGAEGLAELQAMGYSNGAEFITKKVDSLKSQMQL